MPFASTLTEDDREQVQEAIETLEDLGWTITEYDVGVERPVKVEQTRVELVAYKEP